MGDSLGGAELFALFLFYAPLFSFFIWGVNLHTEKTDISVSHIYYNQFLQYFEESLLLFA